MSLTLQILRTARRLDSRLKSTKGLVRVSRKKFNMSYHIAIWRLSFGTVPRYGALEPCQIARLFSGLSRTKIRSTHVKQGLKRLTDAIQDEEKKHI